MESDQVERVRKMCVRLPDTLEKLSHGEPTFFTNKRVFVMMANNHHNDGRIAVWLPVPPGFQEGLLRSSPDIYFYPPYVGVKGWVGIELSRISDKDLEFHIQVAWELLASKKMLDSRG